MKPKNQVKGFFQQFDIFGIDPHLYINNQKKFKTVQGTFFSFMYLVLVIAVFINFGSELILRKQPSTVFSESNNNHPDRYYFNRSSFVFAFALQSFSSKPFYDPEIYQINITQNVIKKLYDQNGNQLPDPKVDKIDLKPRKCELSDFQFNTEYFHKLSNIEQYICIDNYNDLYIEGDFGQEIFSQIRGEVIPCQNKTDSDIVCKPQEIIDKNLDATYYSFYLTDNILDPYNYDKPFEKIGRNHYGFASKNMFYQIDLNYRNVFLEDNDGIFWDIPKTTKEISFQNDRTLVQRDSLQTGQFLRFNIRFEKVKETRIKRQYITIAQVLANIWGILKMSMILLSAVSGYIALKLYNINLMNSVYDFSFTKKANKDDLEDSIELNKLTFKQTLKKLNPFSKDKHEHSILHQKAQKQLQEQLNIKTLLNTIVEVQKLKLLILDSNQQKLFNFIPKPKISQEILQTIKNQQDIYRRHSQLDQKEKQKRASLLFNNYILLDQSQEQVREEDAYEAYKHIILNSDNNYQTKKIVQLIDTKIRLKFLQQLQHEKLEKSLDPNLQNNRTFGNNNTFQHQQTFQEIASVIKKQQSIMADPNQQNREEQSMLTFQNSIYNQDFDMDPSNYETNRNRNGSQQVQLQQQQSQQQLRSPPNIPSFKNIMPPEAKLQRQQSITNSQIQMQQSQGLSPFKKRQLLQQQEDLISSQYLALLNNHKSQGNIKTSIQNLDLSVDKKLQQQQQQQNNNNLYNISQFSKTEPNYLDDIEANFECSIKESQLQADENIRSDINSKTIPTFKTFKD